MDFEFPPDALMLQEMLERFLQKEARPLEMKYFTSGELTIEEYSRLKRAIEQMGLWGLTVPEEFGGGGLDLLTTCLIEETLGQTFLPIEIGDVPAPLYACQGDQLTAFLEPAIVGERRAILAAREPDQLEPAEWQTSATPIDLPGEEGHYYNLRGQKTLNLLPRPDDFLIVYAKSPQGLTAFLLDAQGPGRSIENNGQITLHLEDCQVDQDAILGQAGAALRLAADKSHQAMIRAGARYLGIVKRLIEMSVEHSRDWVALGAALAVRPAIQRMLAEMSASLESARWLVYHAAWLVDSGKLAATRRASAEVRLITGELLKSAVEKSTMIFTGPGPSACERTTPQIEPSQMVQWLWGGHSQVQPQALELGLQHARLTLAAEMLNLYETAAGIR